MTDASISINNALLDRKLLGAGLGDPTTWSTWLVTLKSAFGEKLTDEERKVFAEVAGDRDVPQERVDELWCVIGRGGGKSRIAGAIGTYIASCLKHDLAPGEVGNVLVLAGSQAQAKVVFQYCLSFLRSSRILRQMIESTTANEIRLRNGVTIAVHPNSYRSVRGRTLLACVFDEVSTWRDETSALPDIEVYRAVRPSLVRTGGMLIGISTPYSQRGLLHAKYAKHYGKDDTNVLVVKGSSLQFNPTLSKEKIAEELARDPEAARAEWEAEFRNDLSNLFDEQVIEDAIDDSRPLELPPRGLKYFAFTDASAGRRDAFAIAIGHTEGAREGATWICDVVRARQAPFDPRTVAHEFAALCRSYGISKVIGDNFAGEWVAAAFRDAGMVYEISPLAKSALYLETLPMFNRGAVRLPRIEQLQRELRGLERRVSRLGKDSVDHPRAGSDDLANAVCGAMYSAMHALRKPGLLVGTYGTGGRVSYTAKNNPGMEPEALRVRYVTVHPDGSETAQYHVLPRDPRFIQGGRR